MNLFQLIALPLAGLFFFRNISRLVRGSRQSRGVTIIGTAIWLAAGIAILFPEKTHEIAWLLGIGRGADLVLYVLVISFLLSIFYIYNRFQKLESSITEIIRQLALKEGLERSPQAHLANTAAEESSSAAQRMKFEIDSENSREDLLTTEKTFYNRKP